MADSFSPIKRSEIMRSIRELDTKPELLVAGIARRVRRNFQTNSPRLPGRPDIAFFRLKRAVFVHGCFWHQHEGCARSNMPKSGLVYWRPKLARNVERDQENKRALRKLGWKLLVIWECECRDEERIRRRLQSFLQQ